MLNDTVQSLIVAVYPLLKGTFHLDFAQIGIITLVYQMSGSLFQPVVGFVTDKYPKPFSLAVGMTSSLSGLILLSLAPHYGVVLLAVALIGIGSSIFHPESSRIAKLAAGKRHGLAQSIFQVGGNFGSSIGPLLAAYIILPHGQGSIAWFSLLALAAIAILIRIGLWYAAQLTAGAKKQKSAGDDALPLPRRATIATIVILLTLMFSKFFYLSSITSYYLFFLMHKFSLDATEAQIFLFIFLVSVAAGTIIGGPVGDRIGRKFVIWFSILGVLPFTLFLPYASLFWTGVLSVPIGIILASAFPAILVYAQELIPGRTGLVSGTFFGLAFGMGGLGAAILGVFADSYGIDTVYHVCAYLPAIGLLAAFLPNMRDLDKKAHPACGMAPAHVSVAPADAPAP
jgi:FSR family fosmidomycin resistance protein-like MFS transporter